LSSERRVLTEEEEEKQKQPIINVDMVVFRDERKKKKG
jgi:hypothetical protein